MCVREAQPNRQGKDSTMDTIDYQAECKEYVKHLKELQVELNKQINRISKNSDYVAMKQLDYITSELSKLTSKTLLF